MAGILVNNILVPQPLILRSVSSSRRRSIRTLVMVKASSEPSELVSVSTKLEEARCALVHRDTSYGFLAPDQTEARDNFEKSTQFFQEALEELQLENQLYWRSLEFCF